MLTYGAGGGGGGEALVDYYRRLCVRAHLHARARDLHVLPVRPKGPPPPCYLLPRVTRAAHGLYPLRHMLVPTSTLGLIL